MSLVDSIMKALLEALEPELQRLVDNPPTFEDELERAKQLGLFAIRAASDARAREEIKSP